MWAFRGRRPCRAGRACRQAMHHADMTVWPFGDQPGRAGGRAPAHLAQRGTRSPRRWAGPMLRDHRNV